MRLLTPARNPLAFPGGNPGFDPTHIAAATCRMSAIASNGNFNDLLRGWVGTVVNGTGAPIAGAINGYYGPNVAFQTANGTGSVKSPTSVDLTNYAGITFAIIGSATSVSNNITAVANSSNGSNGSYLRFSATPVLVFGTSGGTKPSSLTVAANIPYFAAISVNFTAGLINFLLLNLANGKVTTQSTTTVLTQVTPTGAYIIGNVNNQNIEWQGSLAAVMYSGAYMSLPALLQWAQSPWDFWYPPAQRNLMFSSLGGSLTQNPLNTTPSSDHPGIIKPPEFIIPNLMSGLLLPAGPPFLMPQAWL